MEIIQNKDLKKQSTTNDQTCGCKYLLLLLVFSAFSAHIPLHKVLVIREYVTAKTSKGITKRTTSKNRL